MPASKPITKVNPKKYTNANDDEWNDDPAPTNNRNSNGGGGGGGEYFVHMLFIRLCQRNTAVILNDNNVFHVSCFDQKVGPVTQIRRTMTMTGATNQLVILIKATVSVIRIGMMKSNHKINLNAITVKSSQ